MAVILVDYENVFSSRGLRGVEYLNAGDKLLIFYSESCGKLRVEELKHIGESKCDFEIIKLVKKGKNGLDFYIATRLGMEYQKGERQIVIVSNDKGFAAVVDFIGSLPCSADRRIIRSNNIENGLALLSDSDNEHRRKRITENNCMRNLTDARAYIQRRTDLRNEIENILEGTKFEKESAKIIEFIDKDNKPSKKAIYSNYLHEYGLKEGLELYRILKNVV